MPSHNSQEDANEKSQTTHLSVTSSKSPGVSNKGELNFPSFVPIHSFKRNVSTYAENLTPSQEAGGSGQLNSDTESESTGASGSVDEKGGEAQPWEDIEPDVEEISFKSLFDKKEFSDLSSMLDYVRSTWNFDFQDVRSRLNLDFLESICLVNYIRSEVQSGNTNLDVSSKDVFADQKYLKPTLDDDALLYSLDELDNTEVPTHEKSSTQLPSTTTDLEDQILKLEVTITELRKHSYNSYIAMSDDVTTGDLAASDQRKRQEEQRIAKMLDDSYFQLYSGKGIHEDMLKDTVRTGAYRDFIYENKHLFKDKIVLDVGCGTGILSMMCAKAGAKAVYAVDNSEIIEKARLIIWDNGLAEQITCIKGKMEEVTLPSPKVDVIVSEWMGYGLFYEAMVDSVLFARDKYLVDGGLMVPSHASIYIASMASPEYIADNVTFWNNIYGFKMDRMMEGIYGEARIDVVKAANLAGPETMVGAAQMREVPLEHLKDWRNQVSLTFDRDIESLDAFVIWFDIYFAGHPVATLTSAREFKDGVAFTTGPRGKETHWQQVVLLVKDNGVKRPIKKGETMAAEFGYRPDKENVRSIEVTGSWKIGDGEQRKQTWRL